MKKIYILAVMCVMGIVSVHAQKKIGVAKTVKQLPKAKESATQGVQSPGCDTANYPIPDSWNLTYYGTQGNGFVSGTNEYGDLEKANYFDLSAQDDNYITGTAIYFAVANSSNADDLSKNVIIKLYADNGGMPGVQFGTSDSIPLSVFNADVSGGYISAVNFSVPVALPASKKFYVSVDLENFSLETGDSIAIVSTTQGDLVAGTGTAWERQSDSSWHNFNEGAGLSWGFDAALAIFPFLSTTEGACGILPVKLISFDAERKNKDAIINWKVAEEINMKGYELERADNNNTYRSVTFLPAHNDLKNVSYSYTDVNAFANSTNIQYRLKQIDNDGKVEYSKIISLRAASAFNNVSFANPFNGSLHMQLNLSNPSQVKINVYDMKGALVGSEKPASYSATSNSIDVKSTIDLKAGMYFVKIIVGNEVYNYKVIKQ